MQSYQSSLDRYIYNLNYALFMEKYEFNFNKEDLYKFNQRILKNANRANGIALEHFPEEKLEEEEEDGN